MVSVVERGLEKLRFEEESKVAEWLQSTSARLMRYTDMALVGAIVEAWGRGASLQECLEVRRERLSDRFVLRRTVDPVVQAGFNLQPAAEVK